MGFSFPHFKGSTTILTVVIENCHFPTVWAFCSTSAFSAIRCKNHFISTFRAFPTGEGLKKVSLPQFGHIFPAILIAPLIYVYMYMYVLYVLTGPLSTNLFENISRTESFK